MNHGWKKVKIGQVCEVVGGATPRTDDAQNWGGQYNWVTPAELHGDKFFHSSERKLSIEGVRSANLQLLPIGTVLLTSRAPIGKVAIACEPTYCNQGFKSLICGSEINNEFLYYYLIHNIEELQKAGSGTTFKEISKAKTESFLTLVPPIEAQIRIASELDKINEMIEANRKLLGELDALAQSLFYDTFGDPITNPKGWIRTTIGQITSVQTGATPSRENEENFKGTIPWVKTTEVQNCDILNTEENISEDALNSSNCKIFPVDTIIVAMYGQGKTRGQIGRLRLEACTNQACAAILPSEQVNILYLYNLLLNSYENLRAKATGANQKNLNLAIIKSYGISLPPLSLQNQFATQIEAIERQKTDIEATIAEMQTLFDSRMDYWFND